MIDRFNLPAGEMDEFLYELREHSAGLNCARWDCIFSCIKRFRNKPDFILADRALMTMTTHFMRSYPLLCIKTVIAEGFALWEAWPRRFRSRMMRRLSSGTL